MTEQLGWNHPRAALYEDYSNGQHIQRWVHVDQASRAELEHIYSAKFTCWGNKVPDMTKLTDKQLADKLVRHVATAERALGVI